WFLAQGTVILQIEDYLCCGSVVPHALQAVGRTFHFWFGVFCCWKIGANAGRPDGHGCVYPLPAEGDGLVTLSAIRRIGTVLAIDGDVHHRAACFCNSGTKLLQMLRIG